MKPEINVTPLIDVLLVLLIIFMVIAPIKPSKFEARIPSEPNPQNPTVKPNPHTLIVQVKKDSSLSLNNENDLGTIDDSTALSERLKYLFAERLENNVFNENLAGKPNITKEQKTLKTVFVKAPKSLSYGRVVKVIDEIKLAGASPISLQIDDLN